MWGFLLATLTAMHTTEPAKLKVCWERAKARAALEERLRGKTSRAEIDEYLRERMKLLSEKEKADLWAALEKGRDDLKRRQKLFDQRMEEIRQIRERIMGKQPPPDMK